MDTYRFSNDNSGAWICSFCRDLVNQTEGRKEVPNYSHRKDHNSNCENHIHESRGCGLNPKLGIVNIDHSKCNNKLQLKESCVLNYHNVHNRNKHEKQKILTQKEPSETSKPHINYILHRLTKQSDCMVMKLNVIKMLLVAQLLLMLSCVKVSAVNTHTSEDIQYSGAHHNVSRIIEDLLDGYDIRLRPQFGGDALTIDMELALASFDSISEVNMDYTITIYLNQYWKDERLAFASNPNSSMTLTGDFAEKIWVPDTFFANDKHSFLHDVTEKNKMVRLYGDGRISYGMRFTTTLACMMDLHYYPLDVQECTVEIESYGYPMQDLIMQWLNEDKDDAIHGVDEVEIPQFTIVDYQNLSTVELLATGGYKRLSLSFKLQRNIGYFIFQTYLPSILIVMLSWVSFWINHEATSARVALGITTVLTMTTINTGVRSSLPRISYVKAIDIYLVMCFVFVFAALLEYAAVNYTYWGARAKRKAKRLKEQKKKEEEKEEYQETSMEIQPTEEEELGGVRMSPILSLRSRSTNFNTDYDEGIQAMPSFRMQTTVPRATYPTTRGGQSQLLRHRRNINSLQKRKKVITSIKRKAKEFRQKIPSVKDVNKIDKYARLVFPSLFIVFNICYWCFYLLQ